MRERPILFNGAMVRAILAGRKTQTRRVVARRHLLQIDPGPAGCRAHWTKPMPFGVPGDRLWVRETWTNAWDDEKNQWSDPERFHYRADGVEVVHVDGLERSPWIPSIHMPRRACRLVLEITDVRVERLQAISEADAEAEGAEPITAKVPTHRDAFRYVWEDTGGDWVANPWVWVIAFRCVEAGHG